MKTLDIDSKFASMSANSNTDRFLTLMERNFYWFHYKQMIKHVNNESKQTVIIAHNYLSVGFGFYTKKVAFFIFLPRFINHSQSNYAKESHFLQPLRFYAYIFFLLIFYKRHFYLSCVFPFAFCACSMTLCL